MSVPKHKRQFNPYEVVENAKIIRQKMLRICLKLPKRYTHLLLIDTMHNASKLAYLCTGANSIFVTNEHEAQVRIDYWIHARATLRALNLDINEIADIPSILRYEDAGKEKGVTRNEIDEIGGLIGKERELLKKAIETDRRRYQRK